MPNYILIFSGTNLLNSEGLNPQKLLVTSYT